MLIVRIFLAILESISPKTIYETHLKAINPRWFEQYKYILVELYVMAWLSFEIVIFIYLIHIPMLLVLIFFIWRLLDIFQSIFSIGILSEEPLPYSIQRMLILLLTGIIEVSIIYGAFDYIYKNAFLSGQNHIQTIGQSLYHSIMTLTTIGSNYSPQNIVGYSLTYSEIAFSILFLIVVIQRIVSLFKN